MELNYKEFGQGDPIIILHGLFGTSDNWQTLAKKLAENYSVYIIDQRNHGRSPHDDEFNYKVMAEDLKNFLESNWIYSARIIGHSMGGKTAMQFAWKMNLPVIHQNYQAILSKIEGDEIFEGATLFVKGGLSKYITETNFETTKEFFPNANLKIIENVGHWVHAEAPKELLEILGIFLE